MLQKLIQLHLIPLFLNYGLFYMLLSRLPDDHHIFAFVFLYFIISFERLQTIKQSRKILQLYEFSSCPAVLLSILSCILGLNITLGYKIEKGQHLLFKSNKFLKQISYIVYHLNLYPLIISFWALDLSQKRPSWPISSQNYIYWITIIYGILHVVILEVIFIVKTSELQFRSTFKAFWEIVYRFILGLARFGCYCACFGQLLCYSAWFLWFLPVVIVSEVLIKFQITSQYPDPLFFFLQILYDSSFDAIRFLSQDDSEFYILNNGFQAVWFIIIFTLRSSLSSDFTTIYNLLIYCSFGIYFPVAISQIYYLFKYLRQGPFDLQFILKKHGQTLEQEEVNLKLDQERILTSLREGGNLVRKVVIYCKNEQNKIFSELQQNVLNFEVIKAVAKRSPPLQKCLILYGDQTQFQLGNKILHFQFSQFPFQNEQAKTIIASILSSQLHTLDYQFVLKGSAKSAYKLTQILFNNAEGLYLNPRFLSITPKLPVDVVGELFRFLLNLYAFKKTIWQFIPINPAICILDLYEDTLWQKKEIKN